METCEVLSTDKATVVIQINPQAKDSAFYFDGQEARGTNHNAALKGFFKAQPKALGTVQIMTGVMVFLLGIVLSANFYRFPTISVISGITYWGSFIYISAGSLSVAAQNKLHPCVVKASHGMNVFSAITSAIAILLTGNEIRIGPLHPRSCYNIHNCINTERFGFGIIGILLVFSILQFIISICISAFACKATCNNNYDSTVVSVELDQRY
ncbi:membrane-spanning 4-domains subfamily A member 4A-like [Sinocyclocheilus anshuiensis]|uniref:membrane-spanning 4-domains subfamily A member 4A-like n=1 Tax=Sinocyclocheilus anshuiensis TaxID=1608454 RepID=UPI0007B80C4E|nr:PREDICTED: membrane-spanning 4-domains subfamily A member 4A-like [Sinocyclocheilus anshuiensis]